MGNSVDPGNDIRRQHHYFEACVRHVEGRDIGAARAQGTGHSGIVVIGRRSIVDLVGHRCQIELNAQRMFIRYVRIVVVAHRIVVDEKDNGLSTDFFKNLLIFLKVDSISYQDCAGHKRPLFLNSTDELANFEVVDMEVFWDMQHQIYDQLKDLPPGTKIGAIKYRL